MSYPWDVLTLDAPTEDIRAIKRAYAKQLKVTRPDDDPKAFQALNQAYQLCLSLAKHGVLDAQQFSDGGDSDADTPLEETLESNVQQNYQDPFWGEPLEHSHAQNAGSKHTTLQSLDEIATSSDKSEPLEEKLKTYLNLVDGVLNRPNDLNDERAWEFLLDNEVIYNREFNGLLGPAVFRRVAEYNYFQLSQFGMNSDHLKPPMVAWLDHIFDWSLEPYWYAEEFGEDKAKAVFQLIEFQEQEKHHGSNRGGNAAIDFNSQAVGRVFWIIAVVVVIILFLLSK